MPEDHAGLRLYRFLLRFYPASFRGNYSGALEQQFRDELARQHGFSIAGAWLRILADLAVSIPMQVARETLQDTRHAFRLWKRRPVQTAFAIAALAIGIGANTGVFSIVNAVLLRSLPFADADRLVATHIFTPPHGSAKQFHEWCRQSTYFDDVLVVDHGDVSLNDLHESARAHLSETSSNFFSMLGVQPTLGRSFTPQEDTKGNDAVVVIGYGLWQQIFGGSTNAIGSTLRANGTSLTVIGVMAPGFDYPARTVLWTPTVFDPDRIPKTGFYLEIIGRLKTGISMAQARQPFIAEADRLSPERREIDKVKHPPWMVPLRDEIAGPVKYASLLLMAGVALILLIACTNVANLLLARTADRTTELSIRAAVGASRSRLCQQMLTERILLSGVSLLAGLFVAQWTVSIASRFQPAAIASQAYSVLDARVLAFCVVVSIFSGLLFGVLPSLYAGRVHAFGTRGSSATTRSRFIRESLIAAQIALTIILLAASFSIGRAFLDLMHADLGFIPQDLVTVNVALGGTTHNLADRRLPYFEEVLSKLRELPHVRDASATEFLPLYATAFLGAPFVVDGHPAPDYSMIIPVLPRYFETMGGRILQGRSFTDAEVRSDASVAVVNERFAREFGAPADIVGRQLGQGRRPSRTIIGVVKDMEYMAQANATQIYYPAHMPGDFNPVIVVRVDGHAEDQLAKVRDTIQAVDPKVAVFGVKTMNQHLEETLARPKFYSTAVLCLAGFALFLAVTGVYGVVAYAVAQRTHELGVRMALGTTSGRLRSILLWQSLVTVAVGAIPGIAGAMLSGRLLGGLVDGVRSVSVSACGVAILLIAIISAVGTWTASRRVAVLDVVEVLRAEN